jgi:hypothetical protein
MKRERARAARENVMAMRVAGAKEGKGGKVMAMGTRVAGKQTATATTRAMVTKTKEVGEEEGNGKGSKSNGNGEEDGNGEQG